MVEFFDKQILDTESVFYIPDNHPVPWLRNFNLSHWTVQRVDKHPLAAGGITPKEGLVSGAGSWLSENHFCNLWDCINASRIWIFFKLFRGVYTSLINYIWSIRDRVLNFTVDACTPRFFSKSFWLVREQRDDRINFVVVALNGDQDVGTDRSSYPVILSWTQDYPASSGALLV